MRALVTGAEGFAGGHLVAALRAGDHETWGTSQTGGQAPEGVTAGRTLDVTDPAACLEVVSEARPDVVFHLAGFSHVGQAESRPDACFAVNVQGTRHVLGACLEAAPRARVLIISSGEVYGRVPADSPPLTEERPLRPATVYAVSKASAELMAHHATARGLATVILRSFNHVGPGQSPDFVASAFARQIALMEAGQQDPVLAVGNLEAVRDFSDVRHTVAAYVRAAEAARTGEIYNVTSGAGVSIRELLETLLAVSGADVRVELDPARHRPLDMPVLHGSGEKLTRDTGFRLELDLPALLADVLDYWRARVRADAR